MAASAPRLVVLAGPNGAGKTTTAASILRGVFEVRAFVNADTIALGLSAFDVDAVAVRAGRIMLDRIHELARARADFAFETTLASRSFSPWIRSLRTEGYSVELVFLSLPSPDMALARVADRVRRGGHSVLEEVVRRRFARGLQNFSEVYRPICSNWYLLDTSGDQPRRLDEHASAASTARRIREAVEKATAELLRARKRLGESIVAWRDGNVVILPPEEIPDQPEGR